MKEEIVHIIINGDKFIENGRTYKIVHKENSLYFYSDYVSSHIVYDKNGNKIDSYFNYGLGFKTRLLKDLWINSRDVILDLIKHDESIIDFYKLTKVETHG